MQTYVMVKKNAFPVIHTWQRQPPWQEGLLMSDSEEDPSVLGTQEHWNTTYCDELQSLQETGDEGEIW